MTGQSQIVPATIRTAIHQARDTARQISDLQAANARTIRTLEAALNQAIKGPLNDPSTPAPPGQRRTEIRSRIEADPELRALILARIGDLTFDQVRAEITAKLGPTRCPSRSSLHRWWHRHGKHIGHPQPLTISRS